MIPRTVLIVAGGVAVCMLLTWGIVVLARVPPYDVQVVEARKREFERATGVQRASSQGRCSSGILNGLPVSYCCNEDGCGWSE